MKNLSNSLRGGGWYTRSWFCLVLLSFWLLDQAKANEDFGPIACHADLQMSIGPDGYLVITPDMVLSERQTNYGLFEVNVVGRGSDSVFCSDVNQTLMVEVTDTRNGNRCWSNVLIEDKLPPVITCLSDTLPCYVLPDTVDYSQYVIATDNCDDSVDLFLEYIIDDFTCDPYFSARVDLTWTATDDQGMQSTCSSSIYFAKQDIADVVFPSDTSVSCTGVDSLDAGFPTIDGLPISGLCELIDFSSDDTIPGRCSGEYTIAREWIVTDFCRVGISRSRVQMITVVDTTAPMLVCTDTTTIGTEPTSCTGNYIIPQAVVTDACGADSLITVTYQQAGGPMLMPGDTVVLDTGFHTFLCTAMDDCGNSTTCFKTIEVVDDVAPTLVCIPELDVYLDSVGFGKICLKDLDHRNFYFDNCGIDSISISKMEEVCDTLLNPYPGFCVTFCCEEVMDSNLMVIITVRDLSGNENFCMISTDVQDTLPPIITEHPNDTTVSCTVDYRDTSVTGGRVIFTDNCFSAIDVTFEDVFDSISVCSSGLIIRRFFVCDPMGNCDSADQIITVVNDFVFDSMNVILPEDSLCIEDCPSSYHPDSIGSRVEILGDSCNVVMVSWVNIDSFVRPGDVCLIIEREWTIENFCNDTFVLVDTQYIEIKNFLPPMLSGPPTDTIVVLTGGDSCSANVVLPELEATDCSTGLMITNDCAFCTGSGPIVEGNFPVGTTTITYTATDSCGNSSTWVTNVSVVDSVGPGLVCPMDTTVNCMTPTDTGTLGSPMITENCGEIDSVVLTFMDVVIPGSCPQEFTIERTFTATDTSGNSSTCLQTIMVVDTLAPELVCPPDITISCESPRDTMTLGRPIAMDNCQGSINITFTDSISPGGCANEGSLIRTFMAVDSCGNSSTCIQRITILDTIAPDLTCPPDVTVECTEDADPTNTGFPMVNDNCDLNPMVTRNDSIVPGRGQTIRTIFREWFVEDECGNRDSCTQVIIVMDTESPTIVCPPDTTVGCDTPIDDLTIFGGPQAMDNCTGVFIQSDTILELNICNVGTITRIFTAIDSAGNTAECEQVITLVLTDTLDESGIIWPDSIIEVDACVGVNPDSIPRGRPMLDSMSATCFLVSFMFSDSVDYNCVPGVCTTLTRKWTLVDSCQLDTATGQGIFMFTQEIRVVDTMRPELEIFVNGMNTAPIFTDSIFLGPNNTNCDTFLNIMASADDCSGIRAITNNSQVGGNGMEDASGVYPRGIHPITFIAEDSCCNADTQLLVLLVLDTIRPTIQCQDALMNLSGEFPMEMAEFCVSDLVSSTMDNCDSQLDLTISFDPNDPSDTCRIYNCDSLNGNREITRMLTLYVTDVSGNVTTCVSEITVRDPFNICGRSLIGGSVSNMIGVGIENAQVEIPEMEEMKMTDENGTYSFKEMQNGLAYTLQVSREEDDPLDGVGIVDLILLQRHLLGITVFDSPYEYIAADANGSRSLEVSDMVQIRKLILGHIPYFVQSPTWSFVDAQYRFDPDLFPTEQREAFTYHIDKLKSHMNVGFRRS